MDCDDCLLVTCDLAVIQALEIVGKRIRGMRSRAIRSDLKTCHTSEIHTRIYYASVNRTCEELLDGAWISLETVVPGMPDLYAALDAYVRELVERKEPHTRERLRSVVAVYA